MKKVLLVDGNSFFYRSYYASIKFSENLYNSKGGVYTAIRMLKKFLNDHKYQKILFTFDLDKKTIKHKIWPKYKITRKKTPDDLIQQMFFFEEFLNCLQIQFFKNIDFEADDLIASLAKIALKKGFEVDIITNDRDLLQIIEKNVNLFFTQSGVTKIEKINLMNFFDKYKINPWQVTDLKALIGDISDNLPGVKGIGPKTALKLIHQFSKLEIIYENLQDIPLQIKNKLIKFKMDAFLTKDLGKLKNDISLFPEFEEQEYDFYSIPVINFYKKHNMFSLIKRPKIQNKFKY